MIFDDEFTSFNMWYERINMAANRKLDTYIALFGNFTKLAQQSLASLMNL